MEENKKLKMGKRYRLRLGRLGEWIINVAQNDKELEDFNEDTFSLLFTARITSGCQIESDPNTFALKMEEMGWKRAKGCVFSQKQLTRRELEKALEKTKRLILAFEGTKKLIQKIQVNDLFRHLKNNESTDEPRTFLTGHQKTQICFQIAASLDNFTKQIMIDQSVVNHSVVCL